MEGLFFRAPPAMERKQMKAKTIRLSATCLVCGLLLLVNGAFAGTLGKQQVYAHRGVTVNHPENSRASIQAAIDLGINGSEVDLRTTRDKHLVLLHDENLERTTTGKGKVGDMNLAQLQALFLKDGSGKVTKEKILTLEQALDLARPHTGFTLTLDLKDADPAVAGQAVLAKNMADRVYFVIADPIKDVEKAKTLKALSPRLMIAVDLLTWWKIEGVPTFAAKALDADALFASEWFFPRCGFEEAKQAGAKVFVYLWGIHDLKQRAQKALELGADVVSCDRPGQLL